MSAPLPSFVVVVPSRFDSTRLPGKPLRDIAGLPMIVRVLEAATRTGAREVWVATDHDEIAAVVAAAGGRVLVTSRAHVSGTDRVCEVADRLGWDDHTVVVNLQGDEPGMTPALVRRVVALLEQDPRADLATVATPIAARAELFDPRVVKVVRADDGAALYFSRAPIPWVRDAFGDAAPTARLPEGVEFLRHIGLYAYRVASLRKMTAAAPSPVELAESLEQLRALGLGMRIAVHVTHQPPEHGVDTEEDLARVARAFAEGSHG